ncbi:unannotated protein [freshwater metagenome]|uniref:Unannotated protein n=1 Tax=freshwater metagenome TaxID=449393 RepID=A0A6J7IKT7_9ZZZZ|nr:hypothetical protein [Actinomycetota bacterium]
MFRGLRAVPWILVLAALRVLYDHWQRLEEQDRRRVAAILRSSRGFPNRMDYRARRDIVDIARRLDPLSLGRDLADAGMPFRIPGLRSKPPRRG